MKRGYRNAFARFGGGYARQGSYKPFRGRTRTTTYRRYQRAGKWYRRYSKAPVRRAKRTMTHYRHMGGKHKAWATHLPRPRFVTTEINDPFTALTRSSTAWVTTDAWDPIQQIVDVTKVSFQQTFPLNYSRNFANDAIVIGSIPIAPNPFARPNGYTEMQAIYQIVQVRKVKMIITVDAPATETASDESWRLILQAFPHSMYSSLPDNIEELQAQHVPSKTRVIKRNATKTSYRISLTVKPSDLDPGYPGYYTNDGSWFDSRTSTPPFFHPTFVVSTVRTDTTQTPPATQLYNIRVKFVAWQRWWAKDSSNIQLEQQLDARPPRELKERKEGKEEKKEDDDDDDDPEFASYKDMGKALSGISTPTPPATPVAIKPGSCLNPAHPRVAHERVGTCI